MNGVLMCFQFGKTVVIILENSAPDFVNIFNDLADWNLDGRAYFPIETFWRAG